MAIDNATLKNGDQNEPKESKCYLLALPLEIRLMIYKISLQIQKIGQTPAHAIRGRPVANPHVDRRVIACLSRHGTHPYIDNYGYHGYKALSILGPPTSGFCALRLANRQMSDETRMLLHVPGIALTMSDDLVMKLCGNPEMHSFFRQDWVRDNLVTVQIQFLWEGNAGWHYSGEQVVKMYPSNAVIWTRRICWALGLARGHWREDWEFDFRPRNTLTTLAGLLMQCPKLERVELWSSSEHFFELWKDPVGDMLALGPLARRGVEVELMTGDGVSSHLGQWRAWKRMHEGLGWWQRLRLRAFGGGLSWKFRKAVYENAITHEGDCMKYLRLTDSRD